jgi:hypothetical protein
MALGSTQPLTEMSTRNIPGCKGRVARKADNLTAVSEPIVQKMWELRRLTGLWASTACNWDRFTHLKMQFSNNGSGKLLIIVIYSIIELYSAT